MIIPLLAIAIDFEHIHILNPRWDRIVIAIMLALLRNPVGMAYQQQESMPSFGIPLGWHINSKNLSLPSESRWDGISIARMLAWIRNPAGMAYQKRFIFLYYGAQGENLFVIYFVMPLR
jgi:hypothetical protein